MPLLPALRRSGWRAASAAGLLCICATTGRPSGLLDWLFHHDVQVITSTDVLSPDVRANPVAPDHPVYYLALCVGYHDFGGSIAGDKLPATRDMIRTIVRVLAHDGFLPADAQHPPTELLVFAWGTLYPVTIPNPGGLNLPDLQLNRRQMVTFLGGKKLGMLSDEPGAWEPPLLPGLSRFDPNAEAIADVATEDLYVVALAAYELPVKTPRHPHLLWRTRISCPATGLVMSDTLPTMLAIAAPYIGHETSRPVWVNASDKFKPHIEIGNPRVEEFLDSGKLPVFGPPGKHPKSATPRP